MYLQRGLRIWILTYLLGLQMNTDPQTCLQNCLATREENNAAWLRASCRGRATCASCRGKATCARRQCGQPEHRTPSLPPPQSGSPPPLPPAGHGTFPTPSPEGMRNNVKNFVHENTVLKGN
jgi:hypothetical protein